MPRPQYVINMGMKGSYQFHDVFGLDPELLAMIPQPVLAVLLLFPITDNVSHQPVGHHIPCLVRLVTVASRDLVAQSYCMMVHDMLTWE